MTTLESTVAARSWVLHRAYADQQTVPWLNGLGSTTPLISFEESAAFPLAPACSRAHISTPTPAPIAAPRIGAGWQLSVASLERPAIFSKFPGLTRTFTPIGGEVVLTVNELHYRIPS